MEVGAAPGILKPIPASLTRSLGLREGEAQSIVWRGLGLPGGAEWTRRVQSEPRELRVNPESSVRERRNGEGAFSSALGQPLACFPGCCYCLSVMGLWAPGAQGLYLLLLNPGRCTVIIA